MRQLQKNLRTLSYDSYWGLPKTTQHPHLSQIPLASLDLPVQRSRGTLPGSLELLQSPLLLWVSLKTMNVWNLPHTQVWAIFPIVGYVSSKPNEAQQVLDFFLAVLSPRCNNLFFTLQFWPTLDRWTPKHFTSVGSIAGSLPKGTHTLGLRTGSDLEIVGSSAFLVALDFFVLVMQVM